MKSESNALIRDKLAGYLGLGVILILGYILFVYSQRDPVPPGIRLLIAGESPLIYRTIPGQIVFSTGLFDDVIAYKIVEQECSRQQTPILSASPNANAQEYCAWEFVLFKASLQKTSLSFRGDDFMQKAFDVYQRMNDESIKYDEQGGLSFSPLFEELIVQRDALLEVVENNVAAAPKWLVFLVTLANTAFAAILFVLTFFRRLIGLIILSPFLIFFAIGKEVHRNV